MTKPTERSRKPITSPTEVFCFACGKSLGKDTYLLELAKKHYKGIDKNKILRNCVEPEAGLHIFNLAFKSKQVTL
jgi:hypothetical protein